MNPSLVLGSTSVYRRALVSRLGLPFVGASPDCDEEEHQKRGMDPRALAELLARLKAESLVERHPSSVIVGGDQVLALGGYVLGKPGSIEAAREQLARLSGNTCTLFTAMAVLGTGHAAAHTDVTRLTFRPLDADAIARYVARDMPLDCAGSFKIEAAGVALFSRIETDDPSAIEGLPLLALTRILTGEFGFVIP